MSVSMAITSAPGPENRSEQRLAETERLVIRKLTRADLPSLVELFGSLEVMRFSVTGPLAAPQVAQVLDQILASYQESPLGLWGVIEKTEHCMIGLCGFLPRVTGEPDVWELAYRFLPNYWGLGLGTEAAAACRDLAVRHPTVQQIIAVIEPANTASLHVAEKIGLEFWRATHRASLPVLEYALRCGA